MLLGGTTLAVGAVGVLSVLGPVPASWAVVFTGAVATAVLWLTGRRRALRSARPVPREGRALQHLAGSAAFLTGGAALTAWQGGVSPVAGDAISLLAPLPVATALIVVAPVPRGIRGVVGWLAGGYCVAAALLAAAWVMTPVPIAQMWNPVTSGLAPLRFALGIAVIAVVLPLVVAVRGPLRWAVAWLLLVLCVGTAADGLAGMARVLPDTELMALEQALRVCALAMLGAAPWVAPPVAGPARAELTTGAGPMAQRAAPDVCAVAATLLATAVLIGSAVAADPETIGIGAPLLAGSAVAVLLARMSMVLAHTRTLGRLAADRERHVHNLARHNGDGVAVIGPDGRVEHLSPGSAEAYGYEPAQILGESVTRLVHPEDLPRLRHGAARLAGSPGDGVRLHLRIRGSDGTWHHLDAAASPYDRRARRALVTIRDTSAEVALRDQVNHLTFHDATTGLPNRAYLEERTRQVLAHPGIAPQGATAAIFLDLAGFTAVNDSVGHRFGDYLLAQAARRLRGAVAPGDTLVRWGGDAFAVLAERAEGGRAVVALANRLLREVSSEPFVVGEHRAYLTASVGVAFAEPDVDASTLLRNADVAMASAKEQGSVGRVEVYAAEMHAAAVSRLEMQTRLWQAFDDDEFVLEYQPIVELQGSRVVGVEALLRWRQDGRLRLPGEFLGAAEESGLIHPLGEWVLRRSCAQVVRWRSRGEPLGLAVNLSPAQLAHADIVATVGGALEEAGLPPDALTVEVAEEVLVEDAAGTVGCLAQLRDLGVRIAVDDFGTGYASLARLRPWRADALKIAPTFIAELGGDPTARALTATIIGLGRDLGMQVIAEGIETEQQREHLQSMGCGYGQGFHVGRPASADRSPWGVVEGEPETVPSGPPEQSRGRAEEPSPSSRSAAG